MGMVENFRAYRSKKLDKIGRALVKAGIKADYLTTLSFLSGLAAAYFLLTQYYLFMICALLHLCFDAFDGVIARLTKPTIHGKYFDLISDSAVTFLILLKVGFYLQEFYAYLAAGLFLLALFIHLRSRSQSPMLFFRTTSVMILIVATHPLFPSTSIILTAGYLAAGGVSLFSLARQLQWYVCKY